MPSFVYTIGRGSQRVIHVVPDGTGSGSSKEDGVSFSNYWLIAQNRDLVIAHNGTYTGSDNMITPPSGFSKKFITIRAESGGGVLLDGQFINLPIFLQGVSHLKIIGFNVANSAKNVVMVHRSNHIRLSRIVGWECSEGNYKVFNIVEDNNVILEDCAGFGVARKIFSPYKSSFVFFRRCFGRWERSLAQGPKMVFSIGYKSYNCIYEGCISLCDAYRMPIGEYQLLDSLGNPIPGEFRTGVEQPYGLMACDNYSGISPDAKIGIQSCIGYVRSLDTWMGAFQVIKPMRVTSIRFDNLIVVQPQTTNYRPFYGGNSDDTPTEFSWVKNMTLVGNSSASIHTSQWSNIPFTNIENVDLISEVNWEDSIGAYFPVVFMNWPMNDRIKTAMTLAGYTGDKIIDVNSIMADLYNQ